MAKSHPRKIILALVLLVPLFILGGCSSKYVVTFDTTPQGATLVCSGKNWGHTPKKLYYDESVKQQPYLNVSNCEAHWVSGARETYHSRATIFPSGGTILTLERPSGPGYAIDAEYNMKRQQMEYQRRSVEAAERSAKAAEDAAFQALMNSTKDTSVTCNPNYIGGFTCR
jgi:hypothetical protein